MFLYDDNGVYGLTKFDFDAKREIDLIADLP